MLDNVDEFVFNTGTLENHKDLSKDIHIDNIDIPGPNECTS